MSRLLERMLWGAIAGAVAGAAFDFLGLDPNAVVARPPPDKLHSHTCANCGGVWSHRSADFQGQRAAHHLAHHCPWCGSMQLIVTAIEGEPDFVESAAPPRVQLH